MNKNLPVKSPLEALKTIINTESIQTQFRNALKDSSSLFTASIIDLFTSDSYLQVCDPKLVVIEALKSATLKLPINKTLGYAWIIPYKKIPQFQIGYKGYIQLAIRTGVYKYINADLLYEGEKIDFDKLSGEMKIVGKAENENVVGYFAFIETINGFKKSLAWTKEKMITFAKKYSPSYGSEKSLWTKEFDKMALKTMIKTLLSKYGIMTIEMGKAFEADNDDMYSGNRYQQEADNCSNAEVIDTEDPTKTTEQKIDDPGF